MPLDYDYLMSLPPLETMQELTARDTILYALGVGAAAEAPTDPAELQFAYEDGLKALPSRVLGQGPEVRTYLAESSPWRTVR